MYSSSKKLGTEGGMKSQGFDILTEYFYDTCVKRRWQSLGWLVCPVGSWFLVNQNSLAHIHVNVVRFSNLKFHIKGNSWWLLRSHHTNSKEWWDASCILITTQSSVIWSSFLLFKFQIEFSCNSAALSFDPPPSELSSQALGVTVTTLPSFIL